MSKDQLAYFPRFPICALFATLRRFVACLLFNSLIICTSVGGELVNTSENAVLCYSCMALPPLYTNIKKDDLENHLRDTAMDPITNQTIHLPSVNLACRETHVTGQGQFYEASKFICQTGACVKLKGVFQGETFVIRECWDRLWDRKYDGKWHGCAPVKFLTDTNTEICVCSADLCNVAYNVKGASLFTFIFAFIASAYIANVYSQIT